MDSGPTLRRRSAGARVGHLGRHVLSLSLLVPVLVVIVIYAALLRPSLTSPLIAGVAMALIGLIIIVAALGAERASTTFLVLAFGFAPLASLSLGPRQLVVATVFFTLAVGLALPRMIHRPLRIPSMFLVGSGLFTLLGLISIPLAVDPVEGAAYVVTAVIALVLMPIVVVWMAPSHRQMFAMALAFGIGTAVSTLIGLPQSDYRNAGLTYHPVALAYTATLTLSFVPFLLASKVRGRWLVVPPVAVIALIGVWTSGSRTGLIVLIALGLIVPLIQRSIWLGLAAAGGIVVALPAVLTYDPTSGSTTALSRLFGTGGAQGSDSVRLQTLREGWAQIQASPVFGSGYSTEDIYVIHNIYVQVWAAEGLIGLIGLLLMLAAFLPPLRLGSPLERCLAYPAVAVILSGPFQPNMGDHYLGLTLGLSLVAAVAVMNDRDRRSRGEPYDSREPVTATDPPAML